MPKKKSGRRTARDFGDKLDRLIDFVAEVEAAGLSDQAVTWSYDVALVKTAVAFEHLMLDCIVTAINNDTSTITARTGIRFPRHLTDEVCEYLVTGGAFFDFKGRDGLIKQVREYVPETHWLLTVVKRPAYKSPLDQLLALRNFAAHESPASRRKAREAVGQQKIGSAGSWVKRQGRFHGLLIQLKSLASEIEASAP